MNHRYAFKPTFVSCLAFLLAVLFLGATGGAQDKTQDKTQDKAQEKPSEKQQEKAPEKSLIDTTPVAPKTNETQKPAQDPDRPVIVNTDLVTFTVTVTDTYGRYVSGLNKNAFTVLDDKQPQNIAFFSDDDAPVSVGVIFDVSG